MPGCTRRQQSFGGQTFGRYPSRWRAMAPPPPLGQPTQPAVMELRWKDEYRSFCASSLSKERAPFFFTQCSGFHLGFKQHPKSGDISPHSLHLTGLSFLGPFLHNGCLVFAFVF